MTRPRRHRSLGYLRGDGTGRDPRHHRGRLPRRVRPHGRRGDRGRPRTTSTSSASAAATRAPTPSECWSELCTHPNVGAVVLVSLGCEGFDRERLAERGRRVRATGHDARHPGRSAAPGRRSPRAGPGSRTCAPARRRRARSPSSCPTSSSARSAVGPTARAASPRTPWSAGCSTGSSPRRHRRLRGDGRADRLRAPHGQRAPSPPSSGGEIVARVDEGGRVLHRHGPRQLLAGQRRGRADHARGEGARRLLEVGQRTDPRRRHAGPARSRRPGLYLLDVVPEGASALGLSRTSTTTPRSPSWSRAAHTSCCSPPAAARSSARRSRRWSRSAPTPRRTAGWATTWTSTPGASSKVAPRIDEVADELIDVILARPRPGRPTASEALGHREFVLTYKSSEPTGPVLPADGR